MNLEMFPPSATICSNDVAVVRVSGSDPWSFLQDTTTQDLTERSGALSCLLDGTGHVLSVFRLVPDGDDVLLVTNIAGGDALNGWLARVAPLSGCDVAAEEWQLTMLRGRAVALDEPLPSREHEVVRRANGFAIGVAWGIAGVDLLTRYAVRAQTMSVDEWGAWRVVAGVPAYGRDIDASLIVNETPLLARAVAEKGCYPGQETVAKIRNLGRARRAVVGLTLDGEVAVGAPVSVDGEQVGSVTSVGFDAAIATVRSEVTGTVSVDGARGEVRAL